MRQINGQTNKQMNREKKNMLNTDLKAKFVIGSNSHFTARKINCQTDKQINREKNKLKRRNLELIINRHFYIETDKFNRQTNR